MFDSRINIVTVDPWFSDLKLKEHLVCIAKIKISSQCQVSSLFFKLTLQYCHIAKAFCKVSCLLESTTLTDV